MEQEMEERKARNLAKFESLIRNGNKSNSDPESSHRKLMPQVTPTQNQSTLLASLSQLRLNDI